MAASVYIVGVDCLSRQRRQAMADDEFWADVYPHGDPMTYADELNECFGVDSPAPCPECGSIVACGYDSLGRPMIHLTEDDDA